MALGLIVLGICLGTRLVLGISAFSEIGLLELLKALLVGTGFDLVTVIYVLTPTLLLLLVIPSRWLNSRVGQILQWLWLALNA